MKVLFLSPRQCQPLQSGAKLRDFYFAQALGRAAELTYVYFGADKAIPMTAAEMPFCRELVWVPKPDTYAPLRLLRGIVSRTPLPVLNYASREMDHAVEQLKRRVRFDLVHADSIHMKRYAGMAGRSEGSLTVFNWHNIESEAMRRFAGTVRSRPKAWYANMTATKLERAESSILRHASGHVVCSERERTRLLEVMPSTSVHVAENGVDTQYFGRWEPSYDERPVRLVFVGSMDYFPNEDGAVAFVENVWPHLRVSFPSITLQIVGANPGVVVRRLGEVEGVQVTGTVPDVRPYYRDATAAIVPLRTGGGTRLKILESMSVGTPVISTAIGAEGLEVSSGKHILFAAATDAPAWVKHVRTLLDNQTYRVLLANNARALAVDRYDWRSIGNRLADVYLSWHRKAR